MAASVDIWFEFASTYSYLAVERIETLAAVRGVTVRWRPFLLGPIFKAQGWTDSPFNLYPVKGRYMWRDMERLCDQYAIPFRKPSRSPRPNLIAARATIAAGDAAWVPGFVRGVYRANIAEDRETGERDVVAAVLAGVGADASAVLAAAKEPGGKERLRRPTKPSGSASSVRRASSRGTSSSGETIGSTMRSTGRPGRADVAP